MSKNVKEVLFIIGGFLFMSWVGPNVWDALNPFQFLIVMLLSLSGLRTLIEFWSNHEMGKLMINEMNKDKNKE